jgi:ribosomal protein S18 acetylase RimI-like enzyme
MIRQMGDLEMVLVTADDVALFDGVHALIAEGVSRGEALGLVEPPSRAEYHSYLSSLLARSSSVDSGVVAAVRDDQVVGTAQWSRSSYSTRRVLAELDQVAVAPEARGSGVGRLVVEAMLADAAEYGVEVMVLEVRGNNHGAIALYERCAFTRCGLIPNAVADGEDRYDIVLMARELSRPAGVRLIGSAPPGAGSSRLSQRRSGRR